MPCFSPRSHPAGIAAWAGSLLALAGACMAAEPAPRIACSQPIYDFGTTNVETNINHILSLENKGNAPLNIRRIRAPCGCITTALPTNTILPGQSFPLTVSISLRGQSRTIRNSVIIESNDPQQPHFRLEFSGTLKLDIDVQPRVIDFGVREPGESTERFASLTASSGVNFHVTGLKIDSPAFTGAITTNVPGRHYQLNVQAHPAAAGSRVDAVAHVFTDHPRYPELAISLTQYISSDIVAVPRRLTLYIQENEIAPPRYIAVASRSNKPFTITGVELPFPDMSAQIQPEGPARYRIVIQGGAISEELNDKQVVIKTDRAGMDPLRIPIAARAQP